MENKGDNEMMELVHNVLQNSDISAAELKYLLECRDKGTIDFTLIDIREMFEYTQLSIKGCDLLLPTSTIHTCMEALQKRKSNFLIFYCRTGNRTAQMLHILKRMGFSKIAHLGRGIVDFKGEKLKNAPLPLNITCKG